MDGKRDDEKLTTINRQIQTLKRLSEDLKVQIDEDSRDLDFGSGEAKSLLTRAKMVTYKIKNVSAGRFNVLLWMCAIFIVFVILYYLFLWS